VYEHVHIRESRKLSNNLERQDFELVRIKKCKVKAGRIQRMDYSIDCYVSRLAISLSRATQLCYALLSSQGSSVIKIIQVNL